MPTDDRCSLRSLLRHEAPIGTASTYRAWLLLEQPGPWGADALRESRLSDGLGERLDALTNRLGIKVLLIRRHGGGGDTADSHRCFLAYTGVQRSFVETTVLASLSDVLDLDLTALARGESPGLHRHDDPLYLVCTHGKHDACCAERGRPVAAALAKVEPTATWECSHMGGDRFAGNMLCLPTGVYFGRLTAENAVRVAHAYAAGRLDLDTMRGRCAYPFAVQAAEIFLRRHLDRTATAELPITGARTGNDGETLAVFTDGEHTRWRVRVRTSRGPAFRLSCSDELAAPPPVHELVGITPAE